MATKPPLIIPVENQVRELDPKLLLACIAARRGFTSYIGSRREVHFNITSFPRGVYLSKSITAASDLMFRIMRNLGHAVVAWDEEALVHLPDDIYYSRRLSPKAMTHVSKYFAWGEDNAELWQRYPLLPAGADIHVTGNPRNDLLRPELHPYYEEEVTRIRRTYGRFILVNTNFNHVNAFTPVQNLFKPIERPGAEPAFGRAAKGMTRPYAEGLRNLKKAVFHDFQKMIPEIEKAFPDYTIVVRPHPTESQDIYRTIACTCQRVKVTNEGNVVPWLLAARALVHNGCTTGAEAYVMGVPALSYRKSIDEAYDLDFYRLPNLVSTNCFNLNELIANLEKVLNGATKEAMTLERQKMIDHYLAAVDGPLACERILDVIDAMREEKTSHKQVGGLNIIKGWLMWAARTRVKRFKDSRPGSHNRPEFQKHRYPEISLNTMRQRISKFCRVLGLPETVRVEPMKAQFFRISGAP